MRRAATILATLAAIAAGVAANVSSGSAAGTQGRERAAVLRAVKSGRLAVLEDHPATVCGYLTPRARANSLLAAEFDGLGSKKPKTCVQAVGRIIDHQRRDGGLAILRDRPAYKHFKLVSISSKRAHVQIGFGEIYLVRGAHGWRADFTNFSPFDGTSGR